MDIKLSRKSTKPDFQAEFLAGILTANADPEITTFAGGNPNADSFPVKAMEAAANKVLKENGVMALQYSSTQGYLPLRQFIAARYKEKMDLDIDPSEIIITNGSQQALDLFSSVMIDPGDRVLVENPTYLAALQTFHLYDPEVVPVDLREDGIDTEQLTQVIREKNPQFMYLIPDFQNPTGLSYSEEVRKKAAEVFRGSNVLVLEDDPYRDLRFTGTAGHSLAWYLGEQCVLLGTFSKIVSPGMRIGWIACRQKKVLDKMLTYKATMDLHTNMFGQMVLTQYLQDNDLNEHIEKTRMLYKHKAEYMIACIEKYFPEGASCTHPQGGMFLWVTLPDGIRGVDIQRAALKYHLAVCAGDPFFEHERGVSNLRLNFSNASDETIDRSMKILADVIREQMAK
ncbi:MAG: PLP-dependent aminotransferase family protein [Oscillospiraceae bacterium]|nr:PLP-dependent aminotransferase family protein [Oscillospiraceae bacterium]